MRVASGTTSSRRGRVDRELQGTVRRAEGVRLVDADVARPAARSCSRTQTSVPSSVTSMRSTAPSEPHAPGRRTTSTTGRPPGEPKCNSVCCGRQPRWARRALVTAQHVVEIASQAAPALAASRAAGRRRPCASSRAQAAANRSSRRASSAASQASPGSGPVRAATLHRIGDELVEHLVDEAAPIERGDLELGRRVVDRTHTEHMLDEVGVRARHPGLEPGGRHDGARFERGADTRPLETPVVRRELVGAAGSQQRGAVAQRGARRRQRMMREVVSRPPRSVQRLDAVLLSGRREGGARDAGCERRDTGEPRRLQRVEGVGVEAWAVGQACRVGAQPPGRHADAAAPQVAAWLAEHHRVGAGERGEQVAQLSSLAFVRGGQVAVEEAALGSPTGDRRRAGGWGVCLRPVRARRPSTRRGPTPR